MSKTAWTQNSNKWVTEYAPCVFLTATVARQGGSRASEWDLCGADAAWGCPGVMGLKAVTSGK